MGLFIELAVPSNRDGTTYAQASSLGRTMIYLFSALKLLGVGLVIIIFAPSTAKAKCISEWSEVEALAGNLNGVNVSKVKTEGSIKFSVKDSDGTAGTYSLVNSKNRILAKTPEGTAAVTLCAHGKGIKAVANLGILGKREAAITSLGGGAFEIKSKTEVYRAAVTR